MTNPTDDILSVLDRADLVQREAYDEIIRLREALASAYENAAKVADEFERTAKDAIEMLKSVGQDDITGRHDAFGTASRNIASAIRAKGAQG
mgnify:FL=1|jgi:hypothetical protein